MHGLTGKQEREDLGEHRTLVHKQKECRAAQNRARLSFDTYQAPLERKDTPLQIRATPSIIKGADLVNSILNMEHGSTCKPNCRSRSIN
jgi:hypothetical protein